MDEVTQVSEILCWVKERMGEDFPDVKTSSDQTFYHITTLCLCQFLIRVSVEQQEEKKKSVSYHESIESLTSSLKAKNKEVSDLKEQLKALKKDTQSLQRTLSSKEKKEGVLKIKGDIKELNGLLPDEEKIVKDLSTQLVSAQKPLRRLAPMLLESMSRMVMNWEAHSGDLEEKYVALQKEKSEIDDKYQAARKDYVTLSKKYNNDRSAHRKKNVELVDKVKALTEENNVLLARLAERGTKPSERLGDYGKRENYQIVKEYREFCLRQGMDFLAEEIVSYNQKKKKKRFDSDKYVTQTLKTKVMLSNKLLINTHKVQTTKLRTGQPIADFEAFRKIALYDVISELRLPAEIGENVTLIAEKAFNLINELISLNPPCHLLVPACGDPFDALEHDIDDVCCKPEGIVKFTVVPGIYTGHEILMKPIVFTEPG